MILAIRVSKTVRLASEEVIVRIRSGDRHISLKRECSVCSNMPFVVLGEYHFGYGISRDGQTASRRTFVAAVDLMGSDPFMTAVEGKKNNVFGFDYRE